MTTTQTGPFLDFAPDPQLWLVGPTPDRPPAGWIADALEVMVDFFEIAEDDTPRLRYLLDMLGVIGRTNPSTLPYRVLLWENLEDVPAVLYLGQVDRGVPEDLVGEHEGGAADEITELWLEATDVVTVEKPLREVLEAPAPMRLERSLVYGHGEEVPVTVGVRYVVDVGDEGCVVLAQSAGVVPADVLSHLAEFEDLLRTVTLSASEESQ